MTDVFARTGLWRLVWPKRRGNTWAEAGGATTIADIPASLAKVGNDDSLWAVVAWLGTRRRVAEVFSSRARALADCAWREQEVKAYLHLLRGTGQPVPHYGVSPVRRSDLPRQWRPLPALGFLRDQST